MRASEPAEKQPDRGESVRTGGEAAEGLAEPGSAGSDGITDCVSDNEGNGITGRGMAAAEEEDYEHHVPQHQK